LHQRRHPSERRLRRVLSHTVEQEVERSGLDAGFHQRRSILPAILNSVPFQDLLNLILKLARLQHVRLWSFCAASRFEPIDGRVLAFRELNSFQLADRTAKVADGTTQPPSGSTRCSRGIVQLVSQTRGELAQRSYAIPLLLGPCN